MIVTEDVKAEAKTLHQRGASLESIMQHLRGQGISLLGTMVVVNKLLPAPSLAVARETVLNSAAWGDHKESFYEFQNVFWDAMEETGEEKDN